MFNLCNKKRGPKLVGKVKIIKTIPRVSMDEETDYEFDEYENYQKLWIFQAIVFGLCSFIYKLWKLFKTNDTEPLVECVVCFEQYPSNRLISCSANHQICGKCLRQTVKNHVFPLSLDLLSKGFPCPDYSCQQYIRYGLCAKFISRKTRLHIQRKIYESVLNVKEIQYDKCIYCGKISKAIENRVFECCYYIFCYYCVKEFKPTEPHHTYLKCVEMEKERKMRQINDKLSEALIHRCYRCFVPFVKIDGPQEACNIMTCKCGAKQCYACRQPVDHYHNCWAFNSRAYKIHEKDILNAKKNLKL